jgi:peptidoglycan/xylan/chitin deacetylase (PgdA/CDA1 family)
MTELWPAPLPLLPLVLHRTPPGLEMILTQEGVPWVRSQGSADGALGRFVLVDRRTMRRHPLPFEPSSDHEIINIDDLRDGWPFDPFGALLDTRPAYRAWQAGDCRVTERVARVDRARVRHALLDALRGWIDRTGGVWARLSPFPHPFRSAFNLRIDLDEPEHADYWAMARARRPLDDCATHFVCTAAYADFPDIVADLRPVDSHSHGHHHVVSRDPAQNLRNLERADVLLRQAGITPTGYAGPEGRWNPGLDRVLQSLGYRFSSEFQLGFDDLPFWPWVNDRFSPVLQIPVHPVCEGLFFDAGCAPVDVGTYLSDVIERKVSASEPAFIYGHPERRLGRYPEVIEAIGRCVAGQNGIWRTTLSEFCRWWEARARLRWRMVEAAPGLLQIDFDGADCGWMLRLEIERDGQVSSRAVLGPRLFVRLEEELFHSRPRQPALPPAPRVRGPATVRGLLRQALDWETVTPVDELPTHTIRMRARKWLRAVRAQS